MHRILLNFFSFTSQRYNTGLIKTLLHRIKKINNTQTGYKSDLIEFIDILKRDSYPLHFINQVIKTYNKNTNSNTTNNEQGHKQARPQIHYFKLLTLATTHKSQNENCIAWSDVTAQT